MLSFATFLLVFVSQTPVAAAAQEPVVTAPVDQLSHQERLQRAFIYSTGARFIVQLELDAALEAEIQRRTLAGGFVGQVELSPEDVDFEVQRRMEMVLAQDPTVDFWGLMRGQGFTPITFAQEVRRTLLGQRMFFPLDPEQWPVAELKEIMLPRWEESLSADHQTLLKMKAKGEYRLLEDGQLHQFLMPSVWQWLHRQIEITYPSSGLAEGICLRINGKDYRTADVLAQIEPLLTDVDRAWATNFVTNVELLEADLKASGHYLDQEAFEAYFAEEQGGYNDFFPHEQMVQQYYGFPSMETYRQYLRVRRSFRTTLPSADTPEYQAFVEQILLLYKSSFGGGRVWTEVLLLSARNKETGLFAQHGDPFAKAAERAKEVGSLLAKGEPFAQVLLEYSDFPPSVSGASNPEAQFNRGRFENLQRHELRDFLNENAYTDFLFGHSITDELFFNAEEKSIYGPVRGPLGYYFYRVLSHKAPRKEVNLDTDPRMSWQVHEDLLTYHFLAHLQTLQHTLHK
jgi:hypothetical protein